MLAAPSVAEWGEVTSHLLAPLQFVLVTQHSKSRRSSAVFLCGLCGARLGTWNALRYHPCVIAHLTPDQPKVFNCQPSGLTQSSGDGTFFHPPVSETDAAFLLALGVGWARRAPFKDEFQCRMCGFIGNTRGMRRHSRTNAVCNLTLPLPHSLPLSLSLIPGRFSTGGAQFNTGGAQILAPVELKLAPVELN